MPTKLKANGCRLFAAKQKVPAYKRAATANYFANLNWMGKRLKAPGCRPIWTKCTATESCGAPKTLETF
jgi:hypothetical protein